jgi:hypothetical protein
VVPTACAPRQLDELRRCRPDPAGDRVDEDALVGHQPGLRVQRVVGGEERLGDSGGLGPRQPRGHCERLALVHDHRLRQAPAGHDAHHACAHHVPRDARSAGHDLAGVFEAGDVGGGAGRRRIEAPALEEIGAVEAGRAHRHLHLVRAGRG